MTTIKLNRYYPHLTENITLEVSDEIAVVLSTGGRQCDSYKCRKREHKECSLDADPGFEPGAMTARGTMKLAHALPWTCGGASHYCGVMTAGANGGLGCSPVPGRVANTVQL